MENGDKNSFCSGTGKPEADWLNGDSERDFSNSKILPSLISK